MKKFYELREPQEMGGKTCSDKFVVKTFYAQGGEPYGFLHDDNKLYEHWIANGMQSSGLFNTMLDALTKSKDYYDSHGKDFPHLGKLIDEYAKHLKEISNANVGSRPLEL